MMSHHTAPDFSCEKCGENLEGILPGLRYSGGNMSEDND